MEGLVLHEETEYVTYMFPIFEAIGVDIKMDSEIWTNPVSMRNSSAEIEIEAFDSTLSVVIAKAPVIIERLQFVFTKAESLLEYNNF